MEGVSTEIQTPVIGVTESAAVKAISLSRREGHAQPCLRLRVLAGGDADVSHQSAIHAGDFTLSTDSCKTTKALCVRDPTSEEIRP